MGSDSTIVRPLVPFRFVSFRFVSFRFVSFDSPTLYHATTARLTCNILSHDVTSHAPPCMVLSMLLSVCSEYGTEHDIQYNTANSDVMIINFL